MWIATGTIRCLLNGFGRYAIWSSLVEGQSSTIQQTKFLLLPTGTHGCAIAARTMMYRH